MKRDELTQLRTQVSSSLAQTGRHWQRLIETQLADCDVSTGGVIPLILIGRSGGGLHQVELADAAGVVGPTLVRLLDRLCKAGLVERRPDHHDRRANTLWLTPSGTALAKQLEQRLDDLRERVFADVPLADLQAAARVQASLARAIAEAADESGA
ncbi:MarR family transcriptional regulator [Oleiagrimonas sp. C23AA]|uniref:MarR family winged helix-turn-helix transcriptional regulator n=1 Tax=Oleiagrimonas sp. C23AA TaxID=2719047 RepID=UPI00141FEB56|nr:MarR family transcriptional regulator [Oleiagrimonas sp. C23AA]NII09556.1 MarR family transcriptional regulator [Oleiagrimonas sp. C23AA]